jgi:hypothetical protein
MVAIALIASIVAGWFADGRWPLRLRRRRGE